MSAFMVRVQLELEEFVCDDRLQRPREQRVSKCSSVLICTVAAEDPSVVHLQAGDDEWISARSVETLRFVSCGSGGRSVWIQSERNMLPTFTLSALSPPRGGFVCLKPPTAPLSFTALPPLCFLCIPSSCIVIITPGSLSCLRAPTSDLWLLYYWSGICLLTHCMLWYHSSYQELSNQIFLFHGEVKTES